MKVAIMTSSRADYSIYYPLLKRLKSDPYFELHIIAFGTHLSKKNGKTIDQIIHDGFNVSLKVNTLPAGDDPVDISQSMGRALINFSKVWQTCSYDLVIALGDRYEMFAACASLIPFGIKLAHIHGGETTIGAIDDVFRHSITLMASLHFTTTDLYKNRVAEIKGHDQYIYNVGALSIDNLKSLSLLSVEEFRRQFNIDLSIPSILITFHPETVDFESNTIFVEELVAAMTEITGYQLIITMPNADTMGNMIRNKLQHFISETENAFGVESFGTIGYLSCMKYVVMMLGNTSSGFVEASFFPKYVINIGQRQSGRIVTENIINCKIERNEILDAVNDFQLFHLPESVDIYGNGHASDHIVNILKHYND